LTVTLFGPIPVNDVTCDVGLRQADAVDEANKKMAPSSKGRRGIIKPGRASPAFCSFKFFASCSIAIGPIAGKTTQ
jgi:hypothetical protein